MNPSNPDRPQLNLASIHPQRHNLPSRKSLPVSQRPGHRPRFRLNRGENEYSSLADNLPIILFRAP